MFPASHKDRADRKSRGAYYTEPAVAALLCKWAVRSPGAVVLDPSFGEGVFLASAARRLESLGGQADQVHGVEVDATAFRAGAAIAAAAGVPAACLEQRDFFELVEAGRFDAVVGNPPYIRFQKFSGVARARAAERAREAGVELSPLASSWAPFVVHGANLLARGGRLAMLVPHELGQARYSRGVISFLARSFARVTLVAFNRRLFPTLDQDTLAVLASGRGEIGRDVRFARVEAWSDLTTAVEGAMAIDVADLIDGTRSLRFFELPPDVRATYRNLEAHPGVARLADVAAVTSGYVTGANAFFHLSPAAAAELSLPDEALAPAVFRSRALAGLSFEDVDWTAAAASGTAGFLLAPTEPVDRRTRRYLVTGEEAGIHRRYKTRSRSPWYAVPRVGRPDMLMAAMASESHALVVNRAGAAPANTLHALVLEDGRTACPGDDPRHGPGSEISLPGTAQAVAVSWSTSLSRLSRELEGRVLGGGMLKIEPGEAGRVLLPGIHDVAVSDLGDYAGRIDRYLRSGRLEAAQEAADELMLQQTLGLSQTVVDAARDAALHLRSMRKRSRPDAP